MILVPVGAINNTKNWSWLLVLDEALATQIGDYDRHFFPIGTICIYTR